MSLNKHGGEIIIRWMQLVNEILLESGECCWSSTTLKGWIWYTTINKGINNKNTDKFEVDGTVQDLLKDRCGRKRSSTATEFPSLSPDLTHVDFYLWGTLKNTVYATKPQTLEELRDQIQHTTYHQWYSISNIPDGMSLCSTSLLGVYCGRKRSF